MLIVKLESFLETYTESLTVIKRAAEKKHLSGYALSLCQSRYCLINNRLINTRRNVFLARALIKQRLYIGLGKDAAARGNRIKSAGIKTQLIKLIYRDIEQSRHLVYKRAGTARAAAVHTLVKPAVKEYYLCVLTAQLYNAGRIRLLELYHLTGGENLLHERYMRRLRESETRRAGNCRRYLLITCYI